MGRKKEGDLVVALDTCKMIQLFNPFDNPPWEDFVPSNPFSVEDVKRIPEKLFRSKPWNLEKRCNRKTHLGRIAYLAYEGWIKPIDVDFGVPGHCGSTIDDGYHRLCAAHVRGEPAILASVSGAMVRINKYTYRGLKS